MGTLTVRNVDDDLLARTAKAARQHNRSLSAEVRELMAESDRKRRVEELLTNIKERREAVHRKYGPMESSSSLIRAVRDEV